MLLWPSSSWTVRISHRLAQTCSGGGIKIKRALYFLQWPAFYSVRIDHSCAHVTVAQQFLDRPNVIACLQHMAGKAVTKSMRGDALTQLCLPYSTLQCFPGTGFMQMINWIALAACSCCGIAWPFSWSFLIK